MAIPEIIAQAKTIDVADLVGRYTSLERVSSSEWQGPCPKCGGDDRLHCTDEWWFCRQCHPKRGDAIDFIRHVTGCTFQEATERLTNQPWPERKTRRHQAKAQRADDRDAGWFENASDLLRQHQASLPESEGAAYLTRRGLKPETWVAFGLGFAHAKNKDADAELPAIAMPWFRGGKLTAIRYRFLNPPAKQKITSLPGSKFGGVLFGGQGLPSWVHEPIEDGKRGSEQFCTLVVCEGEMNAMSIWQVAHHAGVHVMSVGSETSRLSGGTVTYAQRYGTVVIWMDKEELAKQLMTQIPGSFGFSSPGGKDANDLLQKGILGGQLTALRMQAARTDDERRRLIFDLWDAAHDGGVDSSTAAAYARLCNSMGREFDWTEVEPGIWRTRLRVSMGSLMQD
jgi:hypothetical protein